MGMKAVLVVGLLAVAGCADPPEIWDRPQTTRDQFQVDATMCKLEAAQTVRPQAQTNERAAEPATFQGTSTVAVGPDPSVRFGGNVHQTNFDTEDHRQAIHQCMESKGYILRQ
jgi:hypothetical protein